MRALGVLRAEHQDDPLVRLLIEAAIFHTEANLRVLDRAGDELADLAAYASPSIAAEPVREVMRRAARHT